ncbi:antibiotic transporter [Sulfolobus acidocaldarius SUSAZ]|nr:antibiotic transporter [Sulfolobus acidocaldarius SUSAZ]
MGKAPFITFLIIAIILSPIVLMIQNNFVYSDSPFLTPQYSSVRVDQILVKDFNYSSYDNIYIIASGNYSQILDKLNNSLRYLSHDSKLITPYEYLKMFNETLQNYSKPLIEEIYTKILPLYYLYGNLTLEKLIILSNFTYFTYQLNVTYGIPQGKFNSNSTQAVLFKQIFLAQPGSFLEKARNASLYVFRDPFILLFSFANYSNTSLAYKTIMNFSNYSYLIYLLTGKSIPESALENPYVYAEKLVFSKVYTLNLSISNFHKDNQWLFIVQVPSNESLQNIEKFISSINYTVTGHLPVYADSASTTESDLRVIDIVTILLVAILLSVLIRALVPIILLIISAVIGLEIAYTALYISTFLGYSIYYISGLVIPPIVFGITIDYSVLFLYRYFEEVSKGSTFPLNKAYRNARKAILFSGLSIGLGFLSFLISPSPLLKNIGIALVIASLSALIPSILFMKSALSIVPIKYLKFPRKQLPSSIDIRQQYLSKVSRKSINYRYIVLASMILIAIFSYLVFIHGSTNGDISEIVSPNSKVLVGEKELNNFFNYSVDYVIIKGNPNQSYSQIYSLSKYVIDRGGFIIGPAGIGRTLLNTTTELTNFFFTGNYTLVEIYIPSPVFSNQAINFTENLIKMGYLVGGANAERVDIIDNTVSIYYSFVLPVTILIITLYLGLVLGSIIVPIRLSLTLLLSSLFGVALLHIIFGSVYWLSPLIVFAIMYSLGIDYDMFIIVRILEEEGNEEERIVKSVESTGLAVTAAGLILAGAFMSLIVSNMRFLQEIGLAVGLTILFDTFIVRPILVPAVMSILKKYNWWPTTKTKS